MSENDNGKPADLELVRDAGGATGADLAVATWKAIQAACEPLYENDQSLAVAGKQIAQHLADHERRLARLEGGSPSTPVVNLHLHDGAKRVVRDEAGVIVGTEPVPDPDPAA